MLLKTIGPSRSIPFSDPVPMVSVGSRIPRILIRNKVHISGCALVAVWAWARLIGAPLSAEALVIVPGVIAAIYHWNRLTDSREDVLNCPDDFFAALHRKNTICGFCLLVVALTVFTIAMSREWLPGTFLGCSLVLGFLYSTPLVPGRQQLRLKNVALLKNPAAALLWSMLTVLYPASQAVRADDIRMWWGFCYMFLAVYMVELIWDIRDVSGDEAAGIRTVPVIIGNDRTKFAVLLPVNALLSLLVLVGLALGYVPTAWCYLLVNNLITAVWTVVVADRIPIERVWADTLVILQVALLVFLGVLAG